MSVLDNIKAISDYINKLEIENKRIPILEDEVNTLTIELSWRDDAIEHLEGDLYELENEVDSLKRELENIER